MAKKQKKKGMETSKKIGLIAKCIAILVIVLGIAAGWLYHSYQVFSHEPLKLQASERIVQIPAGSSAGSVARLLAKEGIIEHEWMMRVIFLRSGHAEHLQPGAVVLTPDLTPLDLPEVIARVGKYARHSVQILSGMNLYEIAARLQIQRIADQKTFLAMALDPRRAREAGIPASSFEGYLAPGAYTFEAGTPTEAVLDEMHARWTSQWNKIIDEHRGPYETALKRLASDHGIVTLASIVEKEAVKDKEMPVIAKVFTNRLRKGMKLQSDPTCVYPPKEIGEKPSPERCKDGENAYSTYVIPALPPGPITTPSMTSLLAVIEPFSGPDSSVLLYFVAKQDGSWTHYFSKTYAEHQIAVDYYLKGKKQKKPSGTTQPF